MISWGESVQLCRDSEKNEDDFGEFIQRYCEAIMHVGAKIHINIIGLNGIDYESIFMEHNSAMVFRK